MSKAEQNLQEKILKRIRDAKLKTKKNLNDVECSEKHKKSGDKKEDNNLTRLAIQEIEQETKRAAARAEVVGASGWKPCSLKNTNKRFLRNTIRTVISHNKRAEIKHKSNSLKKLDDISKRKPKFGQRAHSFQRPEERMTKKNKD